MTRRVARAGLAVAVSCAAALAAIGPVGPASAAAGPAAPAAPVVRAAEVGVDQPAVDQPAVDLSTLNMVPTPMAGVLTSNSARTQTTSIESYVWAIRQAGSKIFVGGMFLDVKANQTARAVRQPFLAAFDLDSGAWDATCRPVLDNAVYSLAVLPSGSLLVGGEFTTVDGEPRTGLVALDPATCKADPAFPVMVQRPYSTARAVVRSLGVADGKVYFGGNFSRVVGPAKRGNTLVTSVPATPPPTAVGCARERATCTLPSGTTSTVWFGAGTRWTAKRYLTGGVACNTATFGDPAPRTTKTCTYQSDGTSTTGLYKAGRVDARTAAIDFTWKPKVTGSGVWGLAVDATRNLVHLGGWFSGVGGVSGTAQYATVDGTAGAVVTGRTARPRNDTTRPEVYDVSMGAADRVFVGGSEHIVQVLDAGTGAQLAFSHTGYDGCEPTRFTWCHWNGIGGDYQVLERIGGYVFGGCHCNSAQARNGSPTHYSSLTKTFTKHKALMAYDASTGALVDGFRPDIDGTVDGTWAVASDTNGCLYIGGDYTKGGAAAGRSMWLSGIAKLCPRPKPKPAADTKPPGAPRSVQAADVGGGSSQVSWLPATDDVRVVGYRVAVTGGPTVDATTAPVTVTGIPAGTTTFSVTALDAAGNVGPPAQVSIATGRTGADTASPTAPTGLTAAATAGGAALTWSPGTDAVGVKSYLVYRDGSYVGWSATTSWTDTSAPRGTEVSYAVRAADAADNSSVRSAPATITLP